MKKLKKNVCFIKMKRQKNIGKSKSKEMIYREQDKMYLHLTLSNQMIFKLSKAF